LEKKMKRIAIKGSLRAPTPSTLKFRKIMYIKFKPTRPMLILI